MPIKLTFLTLAALACITFPAMAKDWRVRRVTIVPLKNDAKDCWEKGKHGDINIVIVMGAKPQQQLAAWRPMPPESRPINARLAGRAACISLAPIGV